MGDDLLDDDDVERASRGRRSRPSGVTTMNCMTHLEESGDDEG